MSYTFYSQLYLNLLVIGPELEVVFPSLRRQALSLVGSISLTSNSFDNLAYMDNYLNKLKNIQLLIFGTEPPHFEFMGESLIQTSQERFGERFTHDLELF